MGRKKNQHNFWGEKLKKNQNSQMSNTVYMFKNKSCQ